MRALILVSLFALLGCGDFKSTPPGPKKTVAEELNVDCSEKAQLERQRVMKEVGKEGLFSKYETDGATIICWTGKNWSIATFEMKQSFVNMIFAFDCCNHPEADFPLVIVRDQFTGKDVATFTKGRGLVIK